MPSPYTPVSTSFPDVPVIVGKVGATPGDKRSHALIGPMYERLADRAAYVDRVVAREYAFTALDFAGFSYPSDTVAQRSDTSSSGGHTAFLDIAGAKVGDQIFVQSTFDAYRTAGSNWLYFAYSIFAEDDHLGTPAFAKVPGARWGSSNTGNNPDGLAPNKLSTRLNVTLSGVWTVTANGTTRFVLVLDGVNPSSNTTFAYDINFSAMHFPAP